MKYRLYDFIDGTTIIESDNILGIVRYVNNYVGSMRRLVIQVKDEVGYITLY